MKLAIEYNQNAFLAYIRFTDARVARKETMSTHRGSPTMDIDLDEYGEVVGIKFLGIHAIEIQHYVINRPVCADAPVPQPQVPTPSL